MIKIVLRGIVGFGIEIDYFVKVCLSYKVYWLLKILVKEERYVVCLRFKKIISIFFFIVVVGRGVFNCFF